MMPIVSGENDAFEKSFMLVSIRSQPWASSHRHTNRPLRRDGSPSPTTAPSTSPSTTTAEQPHDEEQQYSADGSVDDRADDAAAEMDAELRQQPAADKSTQDADNQITDDAKTRPADDLARQPARDEAYEQNNQQAFARHIHFATSIPGSNGVSQRNEMLRQGALLAYQFDAQANAYFFADGGATGAADPNIANIRALHEDLPVRPAAKAASASGAR
jgi:hypothetical protein